MPPPGGSEALRSFLADASELASRPLLLLLTAAWALHTAMVGCLQYYGPTAARDMFSLPRADIVFGLETVFTGIVGTLAGGALLDRRGASVAVAFRQIGAACAASCALLAAAFMAPSLGPFIAVFGAGCLCLFSVNAVLTARAGGGAAPLRPPSPRPPPPGPSAKAHPRARAAAGGRDVVRAVPPAAAGHVRHHRGHPRVR